MATRAYEIWDAAGRNFDRPMWLIELKELAEIHGVGFLGDLGNEDHLTADKPLDHTPFSTDEYPIPINVYRIHAIDLVPGDWCWAMLADAKAGRLPWMKYMIFYGLSYSVRSDWVPKVSKDRHCHISGMTNYPVNRGLEGYNPFAKKLEKKMRIARTHDDPACWIGDKVQRRRIETQAELDRHLRDIGQKEVDFEDNLNVLGEPVLSVDTGELAILIAASIDRDDLAGRVARRLQRLTFSADEPVEV